MANNVIIIDEDNSDSESETDYSDLPSQEECGMRCDKFAEITGTDTALAMFYLQSRKWDLQTAVNDYLNEHGGVSSEASASKGPGKTVSEADPKTDAEKQMSTSSYLTTSQPVLQPENDSRIRILSWNIDGLDPDNLKSRSEGVCGTLLQERAEIVFLQEVVERSLPIIRAQCSDKYHIIVGLEGSDHIPQGAYFTAMLLRKDCVTVSNHQITDFQASIMSRNILEVQCTARGVALSLMNSHLESTKDYSSERKRQLGIGFTKMVAQPDGSSVIFGGDLNLRDKEIVGKSAKPKGIYDLWECTGKRTEAKFTWDLTINDNKQMPHFQPRCRFDRLYIRHSTPHPKLKPVYFELVGIQRLSSCRRFPSDHWGILAYLDILEGN